MCEIQKCLPLWEAIGTNQTVLEWIEKGVPLWYSKGVPPWVLKKGHLSQLYPQSLIFLIGLLAKIKLVLLTKKFQTFFMKVLLSGTFRVMCRILFRLFKLSPKLQTPTKMAPDY